MDDYEAQHIRGCCTDVVMRYATSVDAGAWDELIGLLTEDCVWTRPGSEPMVGPGDALSFFERLQAQRMAANPHGSLRRHHVTTVRIDPIAQDRAESTWYALVYTDDAWDGHLPAPMPPTPYHVVEYQTSFRKGPDGWKIARHDATHVFGTAAQAAR